MRGNKMDCKQVEDLMSEYIEHELSPEVHKEVSLHLEKCLPCGVLKEQVEELMGAFPELEEDVPFFLKNRLYYIPESQEEDNVIEFETGWSYLKWMAAVIGTFVLFLNLFYFTNIYPPANRALHSVVSGIETFVVKTGAVYEKVKESKVLFFLPSDEEENDRESDSENDRDDEPDINENIENSMETKFDNNGGKND
jgi:hypothetical protein